MIRHLRGSLLGMFALAGPCLLPLSAEESAHSISELNGGYFLLHQLSDDESHVPMLMIVKHVPSQISKFADEIAQVARKNLAALDRFHDGDGTIRFDQNPLPRIEQDVRDSLKADKQHQLLFGTKDAEFVRNFLISQIDASSYAVHLNKVLAEQETDPARAKTLRDLSNAWGVERARAYRLLRSY